MNSIRRAVLRALSLAPIATPLVASATKTRMPVLFMGHGTPMNAVADNSFTLPGARLAVPTPDHYFPLLYALGAAHDDGPPRNPVRGFEQLSEYLLKPDHWPSTVIERGWGLELVSIGELAVLLGVSVVTLRRWHQMGKLTPCCRTPGGPRRYTLSAVRQALGLHAERAKEQLTVCYARVSSPDQKDHLHTQAQRLAQHCAQQAWHDPLILQDLGSGMNYKKPGLIKLLRLLLAGQVQRLVLITKDRLHQCDRSNQVCRALWAQRAFSCGRRDRPSWPGPG